MGSQGGFGGRYGNQGGYGQQGGYGSQGQSSEPFDQIGFPEQRFGNQGGFSTPPPPPRGGMGGYGQRGGYGQQRSYGGKGDLAPPPTSGLYGQGRYGSSQPRNPYQPAPRNYGDIGRTALGGKGGNQNPPPQQGGGFSTPPPRGGMGGSIPFAPPASAYIPPAVGGGAPMDENTRRRIEGGMNGPNMGGGGGGRNYTDPTTGNEMYQPPMPTVPEGTMQRMVMPPAINTATGQPNPFGGFSDLNAALNKPQIDPASLYSDPNMGMGGKGGQQLPQMRTQGPESLRMQGTPLGQRPYPEIMRQPQAQPQRLQEADGDGFVYEAREQARKQAASMGLNAQQAEDAARQASMQFQSNGMIPTPQGLRAMGNNMPVMRGIGSMGQIRRR